MRKAFVLIKPQPCYRLDAFMAGLRVAGYDPRAAVPGEIQPGDALVIWNRYGEHHDIATRVERAGGVVLVAENGYLGPGGVSPHQMEPRQWYALAVGGHNGSGTWPVGDASRWQALGVELKPWRTDGDHILVCPNRSFGRPGLAMPMGWADDVAKRLRRVTKRPIRIRPHPGNGAHPKPLADDLCGAQACVIWSSSAGVQALIAGVPVICEAPHWICSRAAAWSWEEMHRAALNWTARRDSALRDLAHAQWHVDEIAAGAPFAHLLERQSVAA